MPHFSFFLKTPTSITLYITENADLIAEKSGQKEGQKEGRSSGQSILQFPQK